MTRFIQLHLLVSYPPSNLNRDDLGQPKTARLGGVERLRVSSQSLKRAWRKSDLFQQQLGEPIGIRTKRLGRVAFKGLQEAGIAEKPAREWAMQIAKVFGAPKKEEPLEIEQLVHVSPEEQRSLDALVAVLAQERRGPTTNELDALLHQQKAVDIAMFGRMLASKTDYNEEAAVQVAHAIGVHASAIEDDYFTAVDDLNTDDSGAGHVGEASFAAAVFYEYLCIDCDRLESNLQGDAELARKALRALTEATLKVSPSGKQNSFASRSYAHFALVEKGPQQPRSLSLAFVKPVAGADYAVDSITALKRVRDNMNKVYGPCAEAHYQLDVLAGEGNIDELLAFVSED